MRWLLLILLSSAASAAELSGRIVEMHSGEPVEQARLSIMRLEDRRIIAAESGDEGDFRSVLSAGRYRVEIARHGYASAAVFLTLDSDLSVLIRLAKYGAISGMVTTSAGAAMTGATVLALGRSGARQNAAGVDDRGIYRLFGLLPGDYAVAVTRPGGATVLPHTLPVTSGEEHENVDLALTPGPARSLEGRIDPFDDRDAVLVTLTLLEHPAVAVAKTLADPKGQFRFERVPQGAYRIAAVLTSKSLNAGFGGMLAPNPIFGSAEVNLMDLDGTDVVVPMRPAMRVAFRLEGCATAGRLHLAALEDWGARIDRHIDVNAKSATDASGFAPARYMATLTGLPESCYYSGNPVLDLTAGASETVRLRTVPGASIEGMFMGGRPGVVLLWPEAPDPGEPASLVLLPDSEGRFQAAALRTGSYRVMVAPAVKWSDPGWKPDPRQAMRMQLASGNTKMELPPAID